MFPEDTLRKVRWATCAVCVPTRPLGELLEDESLTGLHIEGTGFLLRRDIVLTNRHVLERLDQFVAKNGLNPSSRLLLFNHPINGFVHHVYATFSKTVVFAEPSTDLATIQIQPSVFAGGVREPLNCAEALDITVGMEVGAFGYAYGASLMEREDHGPTTMYRFGPVFQQGVISAIAPYNDGRRVRRLLLDLRTAGGMSGCAIFEPYRGSVIGIHTSGREATTAFAIPLSAKSQAVLEQLHDAAPAGRSTVTDALPQLGRRID